MSSETPFAGYVLVGGQSARMGRDKALLGYADTVLAEHVAQQVEAAAGSAVLVGPPERYRKLGREVIPDLRPGNGPLGGVETALDATRARWTLVVACDLPRVRTRLLSELLRIAGAADTDCVVPLSPDGLPEPLCAAWRRTALPEVRAALEEGRGKLQAVFDRLRVEYWKPAENHWFENLNTPGDWRNHLTALTDDPPGGQGKPTHE